MMRGNSNLEKVERGKKEETPAVLRESGGGGNLNFLLCHLDPERSREEEERKGAFSQTHIISEINKGIGGLGVPAKN